MKELYLNAEMDVVKFSVADVIATSNTGNETTAPTKEDELPGDMTAWG